jgi:tetratricopeptide (TPR) repeat protein
VRWEFAALMAATFVERQIRQCAPASSGAHVRSCSAAARHRTARSDQAVVQASVPREHSRRAVGFVPNLLQAHNNLGNALREAVDLEEAKRSYAYALRLEPRNAMISRICAGWYEPQSEAAGYYLYISECDFDNAAWPTLIFRFGCARRSLGKEDG